MCARAHWCWSWVATLRQIQKMSFCAGFYPIQNSKYLIVVVIILPFKCFYFFIDFSLNGNLAFLNQITLNNNGFFVFLAEVLFLHFPHIF